MKNALTIDSIEIPLRARIKLYKKRAREIELYLSKKPEEWGKFQNEFNAKVNLVFRTIMNFERVNLAAGHKDKVYKLKRLFVNRIRKIFARGAYINWSLDKPFGYAGDFKILDDIYQNNPSTVGFERLFDNYFQMSAISVAVRNRKEDFKRIIFDFVKKHRKQNIRIMNLGSGSARGIKELLETDSEKLFSKVIFDCCDFDIRAINYAKQLLNNVSNVNFFQKNAIRLALKKDIKKEFSLDYDLIYSAGLFDYLDKKVAIRLVSNLRKLLKRKEITTILISNDRDKYSNPSVHFMEWVGDWNLIYRTDDEFKEIFIRGGVKENEIEIQYEQQGIMQYILASNEERV
ncbi:MAG: class I SAM-dependent methyltransferase [Candidatus Omnitrophica bacterium]|nr:class I SAM-dependent methyltransferase [Candidatus Omnitrophota bacterium]